jgi:hypothetical protein
MAASALLFRSLMALGEIGGNLPPMNLIALNCTNTLHSEGIGSHRNLSQYIRMALNGLIQ